MRDYNKVNEQIAVNLKGTLSLKLFPKEAQCKD